MRPLCAGLSSALTVAEALRPRSLPREGVNRIRRTHRSGPIDHPQSNYLANMHSPARLNPAERAACSTLQPDLLPDSPATEVMRGRTGSCRSIGGHSRPIRSKSLRERRIKADIDATTSPDQVRGGLRCLTFPPEELGMKRLLTRSRTPSALPAAPRVYDRLMAATILIVEDEYAVARGIQYALQQEGYQVAVSRSGEEGLEFALREGPDLIVLDVRLPGIDGFEVLRRLRTSGSKAPVLILTARDEEMDKVIGLELGADDYMTKPFGLRELMSRIKALLRRAYGDLADAGGGRLLRHGDLLIDLERRRVQRGERRIPLTATEFEILRHLASKPGRVYSRRELLELIRDYEALDQDEKTINVHVSHLREKLEDDPSSPRFVLTVRGAGYAFAER